MAEQLPEGLRAFDDTEATRGLIFQNVLDGLQKRFPIEDDQYRLELQKPQYTGPKTFTLQQQKDALMKDRQLRVPVTATWRLIHKPTGQVVDEREDVVMHVPYYTERGTIIHNGNEYSVVNQSRLKPGVYVRKQRTGEIEGHFNVRPGTGSSFHVRLEPESGVFKMSVGQANIPLYPVLKALGVSDKDMLGAWGPELTEANARARDNRAIPKLYEHFAGRLAEPGLDETRQGAAVRELLAKFEVDPDVVTRTLGLRDRPTVTPDMLMRTTQKLLNVSKGSEAQDDRDAPQFSNVYAIEDFIQERIEKDAGKTALNLLRKAKRAQNLQPVRRGALNSWIEGLLLGSGLAMPLEETNPMHTLEQANRITKLGQGGIGSPEAITPEARDVNPGQLGFVDPISGPEGLQIGIDLRAAYRTFKGKDKQLYAEFTNPRSGRKMFLRPEDVTDKTIAFPGELSKSSNDVAVMRNGKILRVPRNEVDLEIPSFAHMMSANLNLNPMPTSVQAGRQFYASKFWSQFMPQVQGEVPLVDTLMPDGKMTFSEYYGRKVGTLQAANAGTVTRVGQGSVTIVGDDGKKEVVELVKDFPFNRMSVAGETPVFIRRTGAILRMRIEDYEQKVGDEVLSYDPDTSRSAWFPVSGFVRHKNTKKMFRVTFESGRHVTVTEDHSLLTLDDSMRLTPIYPEDCISNHTRCPIVFGHADDVCGWSFELGVLDGLYLSEGSISQRQRGLLRIAVEPQDRQEFVRNLVRRLGMNPHKQQPGCVGWTSHELSSRWEVDFGHYAECKHIADKVYSRGRQYLSGLVAGYFGGDGCLHADLNGAIQVCAGTTSEDLQLGIVSVLNLLGVFATFTDARPNGVVSKFPIYKLRVRSSDLHKLAVWFCYPDRQAHFSSLVSSSYRASDTDKIPISRRARRLVYAAYRGRVPHFVYKSATGGSIAKQRLLQCSGIVGAWAKSDILWDTVVDVQRAPDCSTVYDFCVSGPEAFALADGLLVHNTGISYFPAVKTGDRVNVGDIVAHSNFTDPKTGALNMGRTLKAAVIPARGASYEDAYVISDAAARKLTTERLYGFDQEARHGITTSKNRYISVFPNAFTREQLDNLDNDGVVKPGTVLQYGDPIILGVGPKMLTSADAQLGKLHKVLRQAHTDKAVVWDHTYPGTVTDANLTRSGAKVNVKATPPVQVGDKLTTSFGLKGVVGKVVPEDEMPRDAATNEPYEVLLNPMGVLSRVAPNQIMELTLGKIAKKTGKQFRLPQLPPEGGWHSWVEQQAKDANVSDASDLFDPKSGKTIKGIGEGYAYIHAFHHLADKKLSARGEEGGYDLNQQPSKGGSEGAKRFSMHDVQATLAHGATDVIRDVILIRGTKNEDYWKALKLGRPLPEPGVPFIYDKFVNTMKAGGINIRDKGDTLKLLPMTDDDVKALSKGAIGKSDMVDQDFEPVPGGLFDAGKAGGTAGNRWTHIDLPEPLPNPVMEEPIRRLLGLTKDGLRDVIAGRAQLNGKTGGAALKDALDKLDIDEAIAYHKGRVQSTRGANRDNSIKILGYLSSAKTQGVHPSKWMITKVPVLPPIFRPISRMGDVALQADMNELYRDVIESVHAIHDLRRELPDASLADEKGTLYDAVTAAYGLGEPITPEGRSRRLKGAVRQIIGTNPKWGLFQSKLLSKNVDVVGRGVITPDPNLDMDSIGIPEDSAWTLYKDFVLRRLVLQGYPATKAAEMIQNRDPAAKQTLDAEMSARPVLVDRAPTWHKFNLLAFYPHAVEGSTIRISPLINTGFNADFDGDQMNFHVPVSDKAVEQAKHRMLPSRNLFSLTDLHSIRHSPSMEMTMGLYWLTREASKKEPVRFATAADAKRAYKEGKIAANDPIVIGRG